MDSAYNRLVRPRVLEFSASLGFVGDGFEGPWLNDVVLPTLRDKSLYVSDPTPSLKLNGIRGTHIVDFNVRIPISTTHEFRLSKELIFSDPFHGTLKGFSFHHDMNDHFYFYSWLNLENLLQGGVYWPKL